MRVLLTTTALLTGLALANAAEAKGCIKGAIVGGVAGHYAGHHGLMGAAGGCIVGRHMANKHAREMEEQRRYEEQSGPQPYREPQTY